MTSDFSSLSTFSAVLPIIFPVMPLRPTVPITTRPALTFAAVLEHPERFRGRRVACVISGGNVDLPDGCNYFVDAASASAQDDLITALVDVQPEEVVCVSEGTFNLTRQLTMTADIRGQPIYDEYRVLQYSLFTYIWYGDVMASSVPGQITV